MAGTNGQTSDPLIDGLRKAPHTYDFYTAGRLIQRLAANRPRIGHSKLLAEDPVRFSQNPMLDFAPSILQGVEYEKEGRPPTIYTRHFGLFGPHGPLPLCLTEFAQARILHHDDPTFAAFCNIFHHRLGSFFFRAWADAGKSIDFDRPNDQRWSYYVGALAGLGLDTSRARDRIPDQAKLFYAGRLGQQTRNAEGLEAIIREFFGLRTELESFVGRWIDLPADSKCQLGASHRTGLLGKNAIAGNRFWTRQSHFRLRLGPMNFAQFQRMLPDGASFARLRDWVKLYTGEQYSWDVLLILNRKEVPPAKLGGSSRLGLNAWMTTQPFTHDPEIAFAGAS
jgi:type VI secretion system protein ImpH